MAWGRYAEWQDAWKDTSIAHQGRGWFDHSTDTDCGQHYDYGSWNTQVGGGGYGDCNGQVVMLSSNGRMANGHGATAYNGSYFGVAAADSDVQDAEGELGMEATFNQHYSGKSMSNGLYTNGHHQGGSTFSQAPQQQQAVQFSDAQRQQNGAEADSDHEVMAELEESMGAMMPLHRDEGSDDEEDERTKVPAEATQEEKLEAERVVRKAFKEAKERDKMRAKVKNASPSDLQALLNARLGNKK